MRTRPLLVPVVLLAATVGLAACTQEAREQITDAVGDARPEQGVEEPAAEEPAAEDDAPAEEPAEAPAVEQPADPATIADDGVDEAETTSVIVLGLVLLAVIIVALLLWRRAPAKPAAPTAPMAAQPTSSSGAAYWRSRARAAYAESRWLYDHLDEPLAAWRAQQLAAPDEVDLEDHRGRDWQAAERRVPPVLDQLYALEAEAPGPDERAAVQEVTQGVRELHAAVRTLAIHLRDNPRERARSYAGGSTGEVLIDLGPAEADHVRAARAHLRRALAALQVFLPDV